MFEALDKLVEIKKAYNKEMLEKGKSAVQEALQCLFDKHPTLHTISWVQYTPYFNDGSPCTFSMNDVEYLLQEDVVDKDDDEDEIDWRETYESVYVSIGHDHDCVIKKDLSALSKVLAELENVLEVVFEEGRVVATRKGIEVEEYNHD